MYQSESMICRINDIDHLNQYIASVKSKSKYFLSENTIEISKYI